MKITYEDVGVKMEKEKIIQIPLTKITHWITTIYMVFLGVVLPLYHREGFCMIGDRKYRLFFVCSVILLPVLLLLTCIRQWILKEYKKLSLTDFCVLCYAGTVILSTILSPYREVALWGYEDWHMGAVSQLLFVAIYFVVSRNWIISIKEAKYKKGVYLIPLLLMATSALIFLLAIGNRFAIDPLGMFEGLEYWNKTHLLSTIGNINWYSGYASLILPFGMSIYWWDIKREENRNNKWKERLSGAYVCITIATILTQGSLGGVLTFGILLVIITAVSIREAVQEKSYDYLAQCLKIHIAFAGIPILMGFLYQISDKEQIYFASDLQIEQLLLSPVWVFYLIAAIIMAVWFRKSRKIHVYSIPFVCFMLVMGVLCLLAHNLVPDFLPFLNQYPILNFNDSWGSGRGYLWKETLGAYFKLPFMQLLFGVGPDCFASYFYSVYPQAFQGFLAEWWGNAYVANAHNEWLNIFFNLGIVGGISYTGIYLTAIVQGYRNISKNKSKNENRNKIEDECRKKDKDTEIDTGRKERFLKISWVQMACILSLVAYMIHNSVSFQQVLSTPLVFMILGMHEALQRRRSL